MKGIDCRGVVRCKSVFDKEGRIRFGELVRRVVFPLYLVHGRAASSLLPLYYSRSLNVGPIGQ